MLIKHQIYIVNTVCLKAIDVVQSQSIHLVHPRKNHNNTAYTHTWVSNYFKRLHFRVLISAHNWRGLWRLNIKEIHLD